VATPAAGPRPHLPLPAASRSAAIKITIYGWSIRPSWDRRPAAWYPFNLLSAMEETRLSDAGRRRLGEMRRAFGMEQPTEPEGVEVGIVAPPIPQEAAQHMSDEHWLRAMARHSTDRPEREYSDPFRGGAPEQAQVLRAEAKADPSRFAGLALRLTPETHPAYGEAILLALGETDEPIDLDLVYDVIRHISTFGNEAHDRWLGWPLRRRLSSDIPDDIIQLILDRALHSNDPREDLSSQEASGGQAYFGGDILSNGTNSGRGSSAEILGHLLIHDPDGHRTALVAPSLNQLAEDPSVAVRACVGHLIAACLRHARAQAVEAFHRLIETDDRLLATPHIEKLIVYIGIGEPGLAEPVVGRMLSSTHEEVRKSGGRLAAYAGLELGLEQLLTSARNSEDAAVREGAAEVCAYRLQQTTSAMAAVDALRQFMNDDDEKVREAAAKVAAALRSQRLDPFNEILAALIRSPSFTPAAPQLFITLERAPDRVDSLILQSAQRFIEMNGADIGNIAIGAAGDAREIGELVIRAYAQASNAATRATALDMIDGLLLFGAFGVDELVQAAER
jgi:HEAT repeat protein